MESVDLECHNKEKEVFDLQLCSTRDHPCSFGIVNKWLEAKLSTRKIPPPDLLKEALFSSLSNLLVQLPGHHHYFTLVKDQFHLLLMAVLFPELKSEGPTTSV